MKMTHVLSRGLLAGVVLFTVGTLFHILTNRFPFIPTAYTDHPAVFRPWAGWTRTYMILHPFVYGFVFAWAYAVVRDAARDGVGHGTAGGATYGLLVFLVGCLPVYLLNYASFRVPAIIIVSWMASSLAQYVTAGALLGCVTDGALVQATTTIALPADSVWERLKQKSTFLYLTRGMVGYPGAESWPEVLFLPGAIIPMQIRPFNVGPATKHEVRVVRVDEGICMVETEEHGGLVDVWRHRMTVEPISAGECRYSDRVEVRAGWLTPLVWAFASVFYRYRQRRWRQLPGQPQDVAGLGDVASRSDTPRL
jgi:hypothetical protein